jgi:hypothetical protein
MAAAIPVKSKCLSLLNFFVRCQETQQLILEIGNAI